MSQKRTRSVSPLGQLELFWSQAIDDRSSRFLACFSPTIGSEDLQNLEEFSGASHRMTARRIPSKQKSLDECSVYEVNHDDDGEKYGGKTLEKLLSELSVEGTVVVGRWYGGILLGPIRFEHIRNCATNAISEWRQQTTKKIKVEDEDARKARLVQILPQRDQSITVLRDLLAEKTNAASRTSDSTHLGPHTLPDYAAMQVSVLAKLEQVRDRTIAWLLAQIDKAEAEDPSKLEGKKDSSSSTSSS